MLVSSNCKKFGSDIFVILLPSMIKTTVDSFCLRCQINYPTKSQEVLKQFEKYRCNFHYQLMCLMESYKIIVVSNMCNIECAVTLF